MLILNGDLPVGMPLMYGGVLAGLDVLGVSGAIAGAMPSTSLGRLIALVETGALAALIASIALALVPTLDVQYSVKDHAWLHHRYRANTAQSSGNSQQ